MGMIWQKLLALDAGQIEFVGGAVAGKQGATSGNTTIALNSGLTGGIAAAAASGDFVIAAFATRGNTDRTLAITDGTTGYTLIGSEFYVNGTEDVNLRIAYKFITADTAVTFGPTGATSDPGAMAVYVFRGVNVTTPLDVTVTTATATNANTPNPPSITPSTAGAFIVCVGAAGAGNGSPPTLSSSDLTDFFTEGESDSAGDVALGIGHKPDWVSGAFDAAAWTNSAGSTTDDTWAAMSIALRPA